MKDIVIIGGGPGGYIAAEKASSLGFDTAIVEMDDLGGTCLNRGCIPTKLLYRESEIIDILNNIDKYGIEIPSYTINLRKMKARKEEVVEKLRDGISKLMKLNKIEVIKGVARIKNKNNIEVSTLLGEIIEISTRYIIIATGSKVKKLDIPGVDLEGVITSNEFLELDSIPQDTIIVGAGVVGLELAVISNALGSKVRVIQRANYILPPADSDISKRLNIYLRKKGIEILTDHDIQSINRVDNSLVVSCKTKKGISEFTTDRVLMATGRVPNFEGLNLNDLGIAYDYRGIKVDNSMKTNIDNIYAVGDVVGGSMLAHKASSEGVCAILNIAGKKTSINYGAIPNCVFVFPEVADVGLKEEEAKEQGINYRVGKASFIGNGKALAIAESDGFVKIICDEEDTIIGVHILGPHASDLIHEGVVAVTHRLKVQALVDSVHAHPTLAETIYEAVLNLAKK